MKTPRTRPNNLPRGIRNCNPLNIRIGNTWLGERPDPDDNEFEQFVSMQAGIRAAFLILRRYIRRYRLNTIRLIVTRWAPSSENNTAAYIARVSAQMNLDPDTPILYEDQKTMCQLADAMIRVECGQPVPLATIESAYSLA